MTEATVGDIFFAKPETVNYDLICRYCGEKLRKTGSNVYGPASFVGSVSGVHNHHDVFECPFRNKDWHKQVIKLFREMAATASARLTEIIRDEVEGIIRSRKPTKWLP